MDHPGAHLEDICLITPLCRLRQIGHLAFGVTNDRRPTISHGLLHGFPQTVFIAWRPYGRVWHSTKQGKIKDPMMGAAIFTNNARTIQAKNHRKSLQSHIMNPLVHSALRKGAVHVDNGSEALCGHPGSGSYGVRLCYSNIKKPFGENGPEIVQATTGSHGCCEPHNAFVLLS